MGASEDRATLAEHERQRKASEVEEIMVPGYGIWTPESIRRALDDRKRYYELLAENFGWREKGLL